MVKKTRSECHLNCRSEVRASDLVGHFMRVSKFHKSRSSLPASFKSISYLEQKHEYVKEGDNKSAR